MSEKKISLTDFAGEYLRFKDTLVKTGLFNLDEIIKLFEVWIKNK